MAQRQADGEGGPVVRRAGSRDLAAMQLDQLLDQRQADAAALEAAALGALHAVEPLEQARDLVRRDADAGVGHFDRRGVGEAIGAHGNHDLAVEGEFEGVGDQVQDHLLPHLPVDIGQLGQGGAVQLQGQARPLDGRAEAGGDLGGEAGQIGGLEGGAHAPSLDAREIQQAVDQAQQPSAVAQRQGGLGARRFAGGGVRRHVLQRPEHQGQGRAELVAHVREEGRLRPVELGQGFDPPPFLLIGVGIGDGRRDLARRELEEATVALAEQAVGVQPHHQHAAAARLTGRRDRQHRRRRRGAVPCSARERRAERLLEVAHQSRLLVRQHRSHGPARPGGGRQGRNGRGMALGQAVGGRQRQSLSLFGGEIEQREGDVPGIGGQGLDAGASGVAPGAGVDRPRRQFAQQSDLPLADHPRGVLGIGADDAAGRAVVVGDRAVGEGVVGLLRIAVALHDQELFLDIGPLDPAQRRGQHRADVGPDFAPHLRSRPAQRPGVLAADDRLIGIVIEIGQLGSPADPDRLARGQHDAHRRAQALGPRLRRPEGGSAPVVTADERAHLAAAGEEGQERILRRRGVDLATRHQRLRPLHTTWKDGIRLP